MKIVQVEPHGRGELRGIELRFVGRVPLKAGRCSKRDKDASIGEKTASGRQTSLAALSLLRDTVRSNTNSNNSNNTSNDSNTNSNNNRYLTHYTHTHRLE